MCQSYLERPASLVLYGQQLQNCLEDLHQLNYIDQLKSFDFDITIQLTFNISADGNIINTNFDSLLLHEEIKSYLKKLLLSTNGMWYPEIKDCKAVISKKFECEVLLLSKTRSIEHRLKKFDETNEAILSGKNELYTSKVVSNEEKKFVVVLRY
jgi:predicted nuclease of restriction endonuclease-like RecB superfamily